MEAKKDTIELHPLKNIPINRKQIIWHMAHTSIVLIPTGSPKEVIDMEIVYDDCYSRDPSSTFLVDNIESKLNKL